MMKPLFATLLFSLAATPICAQQVVHYPDDVLANPSVYGFPFYTPGAGSSGTSVRVQFYCPDSFLVSEGLTAGYVTHVGLSVAGAAPYDPFVLRAGKTSVTSLGSDWAVNLPDQRVQLDLSGTTVVGGGTPQTPVNEWVDFPLAFPFYYTPGDHLVVDLTTRLAQPGALCGTTVGGGLVERAYNFSYTAGAPATSFNSNGLKVRFQFAPLEMVEFGTGCASPNNVAPDLGAIGTPQIGTTTIVTADNVAANGLGVFVFGYSKTDYLGGALPLGLGGGCELLVSADLLQPLVLPASGSTAWPLSIPNNTALQGAVLYTQFAQFDVNSPATFPYVLSEGGILPIY
jgi:hypothetical protein